MLVVLAILAVRRLRVLRRRAKSRHRWMLESKPIGLRRLVKRIAGTTVPRRLAAKPANARVAADAPRRAARSERVDVVRLSERRIVAGLTTPKGIGWGGLRERRTAQRLRKRRDLWIQPILRILRILRIRGVRWNRWLAKG